MPRDTGRPHRPAERAPRAYVPSMLQVLLVVARAIALGADRWRTRVAHRRPMLVEISVLRERLDAALEQNALLRARLGRVPHRRRPQYRSHERLAILYPAARFGLSVEGTARAFVVSARAIMSWRRDARSEKPTRVSTKPPANKLPDLVADLVRRLRREWPRWGTRRIAGVLARLGIAVSRTSVRAFLRRKPKRPPPAAARNTRGPLVAKHPGHVWFLDFTRVGGVFRSVVVGAVVDGFSRKVLALRVAPLEPTALFAARLVREAARTFGAPAHAVTDHGKQFTAGVFGRALRALGARHRYGAVHRHGSLAVVERWWKSMKVEYGSSLHLFRRIHVTEARLRAYVRWFNEERPHQGLGQRTPDEVHFGKVTSARAVPLRAELVAEHDGGDGELPVLRLRDAA